MKFEAESKFEKEPTDSATGGYYVEVTESAVAEGEVYWGWDFDASKMGDKKILRDSKIIGTVRIGSVDKWALIQTMAGDFLKGRGGMLEPIDRERVVKALKWKNNPLAV